MTMKGNGTKPDRRSWPGLKLETALAPVDRPVLKSRFPNGYLEREDSLE